MLSIILSQELKGIRVDMNIEQPPKPIKPLTIGEGKENESKINWWLKGLKDWFIGFTIYK